MMTCETANRELVECARSLGAPDELLKAHLASCAACRGRWEAERSLTAHLQVMRLTGTPANTEWSKAVLMREFDANRKRERQVRWAWAMSSAAVLVLSVGAVWNAWVRPGAAPPVPAGVAIARSYPLPEYPREEFAPAEAAGDEGFIKVPFALPPVQGETFGIVRTQLDTAQLAEMGVSVDPGWTGTMQADLWVGQDGFPQAVRLSNDDIQQN